MKSYLLLSSSPSVRRSEHCFGVPSSVADTASFNYICDFQGSFIPGAPAIGFHNSFDTTHLMLFIFLTVQSSHGQRASDTPREKSHLKYLLLLILKILYFTAYLTEILF